MSLVSIDSALKLTMRLLAKTEPPGGVELLSYKRNRTVSVLVLPGGDFMVRERGYLDQTITISQAEVSRVVKTMIKREFPRSRKIRIFKLSHPDEVARERNTL